MKCPKCGDTNHLITYNKGNPSLVKKDEHREYLDVECGKCDYFLGRFLPLDAPDDINVEKIQAGEDFINGIHKPTKETTITESDIEKL